MYNLLKLQIVIILAPQYLPNCIFLIQIDVSEPFSIFSKYTPLNPLLIQANKTATSPTNLFERVNEPSLLRPPDGH